MRVGPCPVRPKQGKEMYGFACRSMHAQIFIKRLARKKASERQSIGTKKPLVGQRPWGINEPDEMLIRNGPASDVLLPVPVVLPVLFPAVAVR